MLAGRDEPLNDLSATQWRVVEYCEVPRLLTEIMEMVGVANRGYFKKRHVDPLIQAGIVTMTNPNKPRATGQRYVLTEAGVALRGGRIGTDREEEGLGQG